MSSETFQSYKHSGKFGVHGPVLAIVLAAALGWPLGIAYAYLIRWIPFIYVNFLATLGYGFLFGLLASVLLKMARVRNNFVSGITSVLVGVIALYLAWSGHLHAVYNNAPWFVLPGDMIAGIRQLYHEGSWGMHSGEMVTGILLGIIWLIEAGMIIGLATLAGLSTVGDTPYCEESECWLDETKNIDTLGPFTDATQRAAFAAGDLSPLTAARPKVPGSDKFTRLTLKYSPKCNIFYTVRVQDANITIDKNGNQKTEVKAITKDLVLPHSMFDLIARFENFTGGVQGGAAPAVPPPAPGTV